MGHMVTMMLIRISFFSLVCDFMITVLVTLLPTGSAAYSLGWWLLVGLLLAVVALQQAFIFLSPSIHMMEELKTERE